LVEKSRYAVLNFRSADLKSYFYSALHFDFDNFHFGSDNFRFDSDNFHSGEV
jgi:hypothetical protein